MNPMINMMQGMMGGGMSGMGGNNPLGMMMQMMKGGGNPMQLLQQMAGQNPQVANMMKLVEGKNPQQLRQTAENLAKQRGTSVAEIAKQIGMSMPK